VRLYSRIRERDAAVVGRGGAFDAGIVEEAVEQDGDARGKLSFARRRGGRETDCLSAAHVYKRTRVGWRFNDEAR
jgi:hypothetical protein